MIHCLACSVPTASRIASRSLLSVEQQLPREIDCRLRSRHASNAVSLDSIQIRRMTQSRKDLPAARPSIRLLKRIRGVKPSSHWTMLTYHETTQPKLVGHQASWALLLALQYM